MEVFVPDLALMTPSFIKSLSVKMGQLSNIPHIKKGVTLEKMNKVLVMGATQAEEEQWEKRPGRLSLFRHVFLTELIAQMITCQFGRIKDKQ